jgi:hypothetical protein
MQSLFNEMCVSCIYILPNGNSYHHRSTKSVEMRISRGVVLLPGPGPAAPHRVSPPSPARWSAGAAPMGWAPCCGDGCAASCAGLPSASEIGVVRSRPTCTPARASGARRPWESRAGARWAVSRRASAAVGGFAAEARCAGAAWDRPRGLAVPASHAVLVVVDLRPAALNLAR